MSARSGNDAAVLRVRRHDHPFSSGSPTKQQRQDWGMARGRMGQLLRLVRCRRAAGRDVMKHRHGFLMIALDCLADMEGSPVRPFGNPHLGLCPVNARQIASDLAFDMPVDALEAMASEIRSLRRGGGNLMPTECGRLLALSQAEREACRAWTMEADGETSDQRRKRKAEEKLERDAKRAKAKRAERRAAKGLSPFSPELTLTATKPWLALGLSKRTWYRRFGPSARIGTKQSPRDIYNTSPRRVCATSVPGSFSGWVPGSSPTAPCHQRRSKRAQPSAEEAVLRALGFGLPAYGRMVAAYVDPTRLGHWTEVARSRPLTPATLDDIATVGRQARRAVAAAAAAAVLRKEVAA